MEFKEGDIIKGKKGNGYGFTNGNMSRARVLKVLDDGEYMEIEVLEHRDMDYVGQIGKVLNISEKFELVECKKLTKEELFAMPVGTKIITDAEEDNEHIYDGEAFSSKEKVIEKYEIDKDLTLNTYNEEKYGTRIIKIEKPIYSTIYEERQEIKEITIAEIEKKLGYPVRIVKEEQE